MDIRQFDTHSLKVIVADATAAAGFQPIILPIRFFLCNCHHTDCSFD